MKTERLFNENATEITTSELARIVAKETGCRIADTDDIIHKTIDVIIEQMKLGNGVKLHGLGAFRVGKYNATNCRNFQTGECYNAGVVPSPTFDFGYAATNTIKNAMKENADA